MVAMVVFWLSGEGDCMGKNILVAEGEEYDNRMWLGYRDWRWEKENEE